LQIIGEYSEHPEGGSLTGITETMHALREPRPHPRQQRKLEADRLARRRNKASRVEPLRRRPIDGSAFAGNRLWSPRQRPLLRSAAHEYSKPTVRVIGHHRMQVAELSQLRSSPTELLRCSPARWSRPRPLYRAVNAFCNARRDRSPPSRWGRPNGTACRSAERRRYRCDDGSLRC